MAISEPACRTMLNAALSSFGKLKNLLNRARCPDELIGKNSATPCRIARETTTVHVLIV